MCRRRLDNCRPPHSRAPVPSRRPAPLQVTSPGFGRHADADRWRQRYGGPPGRILAAQEQAGEPVAYPSLLLANCANCATGTARSATRTQTIPPTQRCPREPGLEFRRQLGSEAAATRSAHTGETRICRAFLPSAPWAPQRNPAVEAIDSDLPEAAVSCRDFIGEKSKGSRRPDPIPTIHDPDPRPLPSSQTPCKSPKKCKRSVDRRGGGRVGQARRGIGAFWAWWVSASAR